MSPPPSYYNNNIPKAKAYFYERKIKHNLIELEDDSTTQQDNSDNLTMEVNIKFEDLIGDQQVSFIKQEPEKRTEKPTDVMQYMEVMDYIDKCNQTHALLMQQVAETRLRCRKLFYEFM